MPENPVPSDASVNYSVKELIGRVDGKLDILISKIDDKATQEVVDRLAVKVDSLNVYTETRLTALEADAKVALAVSVNTRWMLFAAIPTVIAATTAIARFFLQ